MTLTVDRLFELSRLAVKHKNFEEAAVHLKKAADLSPHSSNIHFHLGNTLATLGKISKAIAHLQKALSLDPQHPEAHNNLGRLFYQQKQYEDALHHYSKAIQYYPHYLHAQLNRGLLWLAQNRHDLAKKQFDKLLKQYPHMPILYEQLAQCALQAKNIAQAKSYYQQLLQFPIHSSDTWNNIGAVFAQTDDYDKAIDAFTKALTIDPKHIQARNNRAAIYLEQRRLKEAIWEYTLYLRLAETDPEGYYNLGVAYMLSGKLSEAIKAIKAVVQRAPNHLEAWCNLGAIYMQQTDFQSAYHAYKQVLSIDAHHETGQFMLSALSQSNALERSNDIDMPIAAPLNHVKMLFDNYADHFEVHLLNTLNYQVPEQLYAFMQPYLANEKFNVLDLGCGTGLVGQTYQPVTYTLTGVDLSSEMLKQAKKKAVYHQLIAQDLISFLKETKQRYTLVLSADTFVYFGELAEVLQRVLQVSTQGAYFGFSIELHNDTTATKNDYYHLQPTGRYQHKVNSVRQIAENSGWSWIDWQTVQGRLHLHQPVKVALCLLKKP